MIRVAAAGVAAIALSAAGVWLDSPLRWPGWPAAVLAAGAAGLLHDPARELIVATPVGMRNGRRIALGLAVALPCWLAVLAIAGGPARLTLVCAAMLAVTVAVAAVLARRGDDGRAAGTLAPIVVAGFAAGWPAARSAALALAAAATAAWACRD